jgi:hypothetical protein
MMKGPIMLLAGAAALLSAACGSSGGPAATARAGDGSPAATAPASGSPTAGASSTSGAYRAVIDPADFRAVVDNPWFPLKPGSTYVSVGTKDDKPSRDVFTVTHRIRTIQGVPCVVVSDRLYLAGRLEERTTDYYTQDLRGNVWYFGEDTAELDESGKVTSTDGTWLAGRDGAQPGIFMEANPTVGHSFRQEYYPGHAEDRFQVVSVASSITVPFGSFSGALLTKEWTALEPEVLDHKYYVKGIGQVAELSVKGPMEGARLVSYTAG